jgi:hypothetical protein
MKLKWAHFIKDELFFFFLGAPCIFLRRHFLTSAMVGYPLNWSEGWEYSLVDHPFWSGALGLQASLVGEGQDGVLLQNTWCSGTSYGGINPYTLMAPHGPRRTRWPNSPERATWISKLLDEPCGASRDYLLVKET